MKILIVEPGKHPRVAQIDNTLEAMHEVVGGYIEVTYPWEDYIGLVCDEEGLLKHYPFNRLVAPHTAIFGTFFLCGLDGENMTDLPDDLIEKYKARLFEPQMLIRTARGLIAVPVIDEHGRRRKN